MRTLHNVPESTLDAVLIGLNNKLYEHYIEDVAQGLVDWIVKAYNKHYGQLQTSLKAYFKSKGNEKLAGLAIAVMNYN